MLTKRQRLTLCASLITTLANHSVIAQDTVTLTQLSSGRSIEAEVLHSDDQQVTVRLASGKEHSLQLDTLTPESAEEVQSHLESKKAAQAEAYLAVNKVMGNPVFSEIHSLWDEPAKELAARLKLKKESSVEVMQSFRRYTKGDASFLGAHPYCMTLYSSPEGKAEKLSLVFANKGDYGSTRGSGEDHFKQVYSEEKPPESLEDAIELDAKVLANTLTLQFGDPETQYFGEKTDRRKVKRWNWRNHAFVLSELDSEYVSLAIIPLEIADAQGKVTRINDSEMKKLKAKNVLREDNGDVRIINIPMVNQGPKGYCAPATLERAMRYMGVPADMYLLAVSATNPETGTNTNLLVQNSERIVRSKGRRFRTLDFSDEIKIKDIKKHIDAGVPVLWRMRSLEQYNKIANKRSAARTKIEDLAAWANEIQQEADQAVPLLKSIQDNHHICMIIGYNETTNELAVSDSWGPRYELRWVHLDIASAVTSRNSFVLSF